MDSIVLSARVTLEVYRHERISHSFTVSGLPFVYPPMSGDIIILNFANNVNFTAKVETVIHYSGHDPAVVLILSSCRHQYSEIAEIIKSFKHEYPIEDYDTNDDLTNFHNHLVKMLGSDEIEADDVKLFAESCRSIVMANDLSGPITPSIINEKFGEYNTLVMDIHNAMLSNDFLMKFSSTTNHGKIKIIDILFTANVPPVNVDFDKCVEVSTYVMARAKSL